MRLAIAVSIILAHSLPVASKNEDVNSVLPFDNERQDNNRQRLLIDKKTSRFQTAFAKNIIRELKQVRDKTKVGNMRGTLRNLVTSKDECDPGSNDADVGVLACGVGRYCMASDTSPLGGLCVDDDSIKTNHRQLQTYFLDVTGVFGLCNDPSVVANATYMSIIVSYIMDCNCDWVDLETQTGIAVCEFLGGSPDPNCGYGAMFARDEEGIEFKGMCFNVSSYDKSICFGYEPIYDNTGVIGSNCTIAVDGIPCNSCYFVTDDSSVDPSTQACSGIMDIYALTGEQFVFDCENVGLESGDHSCSEGLGATDLILSSCNATIYNNDDYFDDNF